MKKFLTMALAVILCLSLFVGCGSEKKDDKKTSSNNPNSNLTSGNNSSAAVLPESPTIEGEKKIDRILFSAGLTENVTLGAVKGLTIDTGSKEYTEAYAATLSSSLENLGGYARSTSGTVKDGDTVNISYVGKKDGVAFDGGTGTNDLTIGSGQFIPGFEDGLIGVEVGSTVDLNLTFPKDYGTEELAGKAVVFTVTVNNVVSTEKLTTKTAYSLAGFKSEKEYTDSLKKETVKSLLYDAFKASCKVNDMPKADFEFLYTRQKATLESQAAMYGLDFATMLSYYGMTEDDYKNQVVVPLAQDMMMLYAAFDSLGYTITDADITETATKIAKEAGSTYDAKYIIDYYGKYYIEYIVVNEKVLDYIYDNAKIK